jgi:hypothetical protein
VNRGPRRRLTGVLHLTGSVSASFLIASFWLATITAELLLDATAVLFVKRAILGGVALLVPALVVTGATGRLLAGRAPAGLAAKKLARTKVIAATGLLVLVPCAVVLARLAERGAFGAPFYGVQALELAAGASNLVLMLKNAREGLILSGRLRPKRSLRA